MQLTTHATTVLERHHSLRRHRHSLPSAQEQYTKKKSSIAKLRAKKPFKRINPTGQNVNMTHNPASTNQITKQEPSKRR